MRKFFQTLYGRLVAVLFFLLIFLTFFFVYLTINFTREHFQAISQTANMDLAKSLLEDGWIPDPKHTSFEEISKFFDNLMHLDPSWELYILDSEGNILAYSAPEGRVKASRVDIVPIKNFLGGEKSFPILGDDPRGEPKGKIFSVGEIRNGDGLFGYLYVILEGEELVSLQKMMENSYVFRLTLWLLGGALILASVLGGVSFSLLTQRLRKLVSSMKEFRDSGFQKVPDFRPLKKSRPVGDEIDQAVVAFEETSQKVIDQVSMLAEADNQRRKMVTNISHDLRTPLGILQGYLETLLMKKGLTKKQTSQYHRQALSQCQRLGRLIDELFQLGKLDNPTLILNEEVFSLAELVQDAVQRLNLSQGKKKIRFKAKFGPENPYVKGDIGLIERALYNILENALKFSPQGKIVNVFIEVKNSWAMVYVRDQGSGFSEDEFDKIFKPFFKGNKQPTKPTEGSGLGLAIAKKILEVHNGKLFARNHPDGGGELVLSLPTFEGD